MKIKIKYLIIGIIIICLAGVYSIVDKTVSVYDTRVDTSNFQSVTLEKGKNLSQSFICQKENLDGISLKVAADNVQDNSQVVLEYTLQDPNTGSQMAEGEVTLEKLKSGSFFKIRFDKVKKCQDKQFVFSMELKECPSGNIRLFYTPGSSPYAELSYNDDTVDGTMVMRTLTHGFDLETFIVTLCFAAYIVLFMKWLYKLFE